MRKNGFNNAGFVMVMVVAVVISMMILTVGLMTRTSTQAISADEMVKDIQGKQYAQGIWWRIHTEMGNGASCPDGETNAGAPDVLNGTEFVYTVTCSGNQVNVDVDW